MFSSAESVSKIENLQKRALLFLYNCFEASYEDLLEDFVSKFTKHLMIWIQLLLIIFSKSKTYVREVRDKYKLNLDS